MKDFIEKTEYEYKIYYSDGEEEFLGVVDANYAEGELLSAKSLVTDYPEAGFETAKLARRKIESLVRKNKWKKV